MCRSFEIFKPRWIISAPAQIVYSEHLVVRNCKLEGLSAQVESPLALSWSNPSPFADNFRFTNTILGTMNVSVGSISLCMPDIELWAHHDTFGETCLSQCLITRLASTVCIFVLPVRICGPRPSAFTVSCALSRCVVFASRSIFPLLVSGCLACCNSAKASNNEYRFHLSDLNRFKSYY